MTSAEAYTGWARAAAPVLLLLNAAILVAPFAVAPPFADDYCRATWRYPTVWQTIVGSYMESTGRLTGIIPRHAIMPYIDQWRWYPAMLMFVMGGFTAGIAALLRGACGDPLGWRQSAFGAALFVILFWSALPHPGDSVYWVNGGWEYLLGSGAILAAFGCLATGRVSAWWLAPAVFLLAAWHEMLSLVLCLALALGTWWQPGARKKWMIVLLAAVAGTLACMLAPGNFVRSEAMPGSREIPVALRVAALDITRRLPVWIFDGKLLTVTALFLLDPRIAAYRPAWLERRNALRWAIPVCWAAALALSFLMPSYALGISMPGRARTWVYLLFLIGWFVTLFAFTRGVRVASGKLARSLLLVACSGMLLFDGAAWRIAEDYGSGRIPEWIAAVRQRDRLLREAGAAGRVAVIPPLPKAPWTFADVYGERDMQRPDSAMVRCLAAYYGAPGIEFRGAEEPRR